MELKAHQAKKINHKRKLEAFTTEEGDDIESIGSEIRRKIVKWSKTNLEEELKENYHYIISVKRNSGSTTCLASVSCRCGKAIALQRKPNGPWVISNWTKQYKLCNFSKGETSKQNTLQSFFPMVSQNNAHSNEIPNPQAVIQSQPGIESKSQACYNPMPLFPFPNTCMSLQLPSAYTSVSSGLPFGCISLYTSQYSDMASNLS